MRILNAESGGYSSQARTILAGIGEVVDADLDRAGLLVALGDVDVLIVRLRTTLDDEVLVAGGPRLRTIVTATTGLDHIDLDAAASRGIDVLSLRGDTAFLRTITATAEHTWALLLSLLRRIPEASARPGRVEERDAYRGRELKGKRLGIVGLGRIGTMVARYGRAFDMHVAAHDPLIDDWPADVERAEALADLAARSDVLTIHVPLDPGTRHLVDRHVLQSLPAGAVVVNTSRGELLDEDALCELVENGHLGGVAADVVRGERRAGTGRLQALALHHPDVLVTPHIGGATHESMAATEIHMARKLEHHLLGTHRSEHDDAS